MKSLTTIIQQISSLEQLLIESDGELTDQLEDQLKVKDIELPEKVDAYVYTIERLDQAREFYAQKAKQFQNIAKNIDQAVDRMKDNIKMAAEVLCTDELKGQDFRFKVQRSKASVIIDSLEKLPGEFIISEVVTKPDKKKLADALAQGPIDGAHLEPQVSLRVYPNKG